MNEENEYSILTDDPTWGVIEELEIVAERLNSISHYVDEINSTELRKSNLKTMLKDMKNNLLESLTELNKINEDTKIEMINNLKDVPGSNYESR